MRKWDFHLDLDPASSRPIFIQISQAIVSGIKSGRLRAGAALPGTRSLAESLSVHRNTVVAAYDELLAEGWITSQPARGVYVSSSIPELDAPESPRGEALKHRPDRMGFPLPSRLKEVGPLRPPPGSYNMGSRPDVRLAPRAALSRAIRRALHWSPESVLGYADPRGNLELRRALASMLASTRGMPVEQDDVMVVRGSQMGIYLTARVLLKSGDGVAVEALGYPPAWEAFRQSGAHLVPIPVDDEGMRVEALESLSHKERVSAIYVTPHHQFPTTVTLTAGRRLALLDYARRKKIPIIEDDHDHEFHFQGRPVLPLASVDRHGVVIYIGTLSKVLAPGLRIGYIAAPRPVLDQIAVHRVYLDHQGDHVVERALADLMEDGEVQRHVRRARRVYQARQTFMVDALRREFKGVLSFKVPYGGTTIWAQVASGIDAAEWAQRAEERGVLFRPGIFFAVDGRPRPFVRLGFASLNEKELKEAFIRLKAAL